MIIAISGYSASGKNTVGAALAKALDFKFVAISFRDFGDLLEMQKKAMEQSDIDRMLDARIEEMAKQADSVVATWLAGWKLNADFRVFLHAPLEVRRKRLAKRDGKTEEAAEMEIIWRDHVNRRRYLKYYGIDIFDTSHFDISINTGIYKPSQCVDIILNTMKQKGLI